jgi:hypothetical protein
MYYSYLDSLLVEWLTEHPAWWRVEYDDAWHMWNRPLWWF